MPADKKTLRCRFRLSVGVLLSLLIGWTSLPVQAGHDQVEDDLVYFLPISPDRLKGLLESGEPLFLVDLREPEEFKHGRLPNAHSIPLKELPAQHEKIPRAGRVVLYCSCGPGNIEEGYSYQLLRDMGYRNISVLEGGMSEWQRLGYPVDTEPRS
jgi:rhodanese-related sulfurtransferase